MLFLMSPMSLGPTLFASLKYPSVSSSFHTILVSADISISLVILNIGNYQVILHYFGVKLREKRDSFVKKVEKIK